MAVFEPLNPVTPGHLLVVPWEHIPDAASGPDIAADVMRWAALTVQRLGVPANIITSVGAGATQSVFHLHIHIVPRRLGDGLHLPWTGQGVRERKRGDDLLEMAWVIIANANEGNWDNAHPDWRKAAERWRDDYHGYSP
jgi:histidine triad (HIT) family protein